MTSKEMIVRFAGGEARQKLSRDDIISSILAW